ncbi:hypothetical protein S245_065928, partial [Arachis hypogaea]
EVSSLSPKARPKIFLCSGATKVDRIAGIESLPASHVCGRRLAQKIVYRGPVQTRSEFRPNRWRRINPSLPRLLAPFSSLSVSTLSSPFAVAGDRRFGALAEAPVQPVLPLPLVLCSAVAPCLFLSKSSPTRSFSLHPVASATSVKDDNFTLVNPQHVYHQQKFKNTST